ncbi:MAG: winged helix-turn-helix domain-containing protein [Aestuariibacter sp.]
MSDSNNNHKIQTHDLIIDLQSRKVCRGEQTLPVSGLTFTLLQALIAEANQVVSKDTLAQSVWHGKVVSDETIAQRISLLRKALGKEKPDYIESVRGEGYRWLPTARPITEELFTSDSTARRDALWIFSLASLLLFSGLGWFFYQQLSPQSTQPSEQKTIDALDFQTLTLNKAKRYAQQLTPRNMELASTLYREVLLQNPNSYQAQYGLAQTLLHKVSKFDGGSTLLNEADKISQRLYSAQPNNDRNIWLRGFYYDVAGDIDNAIVFYESGLNKKPDSIGFKGALAYLYVQKGRLHEAVHLNIDTLGSEQHYQLLQMGEAFMLAGLDDKAKLWLSRAVALDPDNTFAAIALAMFYFIDDDPGAAKHVIQQLHQRGVVTAFTKHMEMMLAASSGDELQAIQHLEQAQTFLNDSIYLLSWQDWLWRNQADYTFHHFEPPATTSQWPKVWVTMAISAQAHQQTDTAIRYLQTAVNSGYLNHRLLTRLPPFKSLQQLPTWQALINKMKHNATTERVKIESYAIPTLTLKVQAK